MPLTQPLESGQTVDIPAQQNAAPAATGCPPARISHHRQDCSNLRKLPEQEKARLIDVRWADQTPDAAYPVDIVVLAADRTGLLRDVSSIFSDEEIDVLGSFACVESLRLPASRSGPAQSAGRPRLPRPAAEWPRGRWAPARVAGASLSVRGRGW